MGLNLTAVVKFSAAFLPAIFFLHILFDLLYCNQKSMLRDADGHDSHALPSNLFVWLE